jgi:hypothetical protein
MSLQLTNCLCSLGEVETVLRQEREVCDLPSSRPLAWYGSIGQEPVAHDSEIILGIISTAGCLQ